VELDPTHKLQKTGSLQVCLKTNLPASLAILAFLFSLILLSGCTANSAGGTQQGIIVQKAWVDHSEARMNASVISMVLYNRTDLDDKLISVTSDLTDHIAIHGYEFKNGMEVMVPLDEMSVRSDRTLRFKKGTFHLMLTDLKQPLVVGDKVNLKLTFERAGTLNLVVPVAHSTKVARPVSHRRGGGR